MSTTPLKAVTVLVLVLLCWTAQGCNNDTTNNVKYVLVPLADSLADSATTTGTAATDVVTGVAATDLTSPQVTVIRVVALPPRRPRHHPPFRGRRAPGGRVIYVVDGRSVAADDGTTASASTPDQDDVDEDDLAEADSTAQDEDVADQVDEDEAAEDEATKDEVASEEPTTITSYDIRVLIRPRVLPRAGWRHHRRSRASFELGSASTN